jgi:predicted transcriptional regulator
MIGYYCKIVSLGTKSGYDITEILHKNVKKQIDQADEKSLKIVKVILDVKEETDWWDDLSDAAETSIEQGLKDAEEGKLTPHKEVMKKYKKWL